VEEWAQRIEKAGLSPVAVLLLGTVRALGFVAAQALLFGQPLLNGLVSPAALERAGDWLESPQQVEQLLQRLEEGG